MSSRRRKDRGPQNRHRVADGTEIPSRSMLNSCCRINDLPLECMHRAGIGTGLLSSYKKSGIYILCFNISNPNEAPGHQVLIHKWCPGEGNPGPSAAASRTRPASSWDGPDTGSYKSTPAAANHGRHGCPGFLRSVAWRRSAGVRIGTLARYSGAATGKTRPGISLRAINRPHRPCHSV